MQGRVIMQPSVTNTHLPPVGIKLLVETDSGWQLVVRTKWLTSKDTQVGFQTVDPPHTQIILPRNKLQWRLP